MESNADTSDMKTDKNSVFKNNTTINSTDDKHSNIQNSIQLNCEVTNKISQRVMHGAKFILTHIHANGIHTGFKIQQ